MSAVLADTSALFALLVATDDNHARAARAFERLANGKVPLVTTNYVLVESYALLMLERPRSRISLVDAASFVVMRASGIEQAFAYDRHFRTAGFRLVS